MLALVHELKPTVVFVAYGRNESYRGEVGLADFRTQLEKLCEDLRREAMLLLKTPRPGRCHARRGNLALGTGPIVLDDPDRTPLRGSSPVDANG
jgi:hypothetical protein